MTDISKELQAQYAERKEDVYYVPLGVLLGNRILSQARPEIRLRIRLISVSNIDFKTEFESQGINQTKYKVHMELTSEVKVLAPFTEETFEVSTSVLIAEAIILGSVPGSYVNVPEEDILDVTTE
jgi:sporulation protein YunB